MTVFEPEQLVHTELLFYKVHTIKTIKSRLVRCQTRYYKTDNTRQYIQVSLSFHCPGSLLHMFIFTVVHTSLQEECLWILMPRGYTVLP